MEMCVVVSRSELITAINAVDDEQVMIVMDHDGNLTVGSPSGDGAMFCETHFVVASTSELKPEPLTKEEVEEGFKLALAPMPMFEHRGDVFTFERRMMALGWVDDEGIFTDECPEWVVELYEG